MANLKIDKIQIKRFKSDITTLAAGEFGYHIPSGKLYLGTAGGNIEVALDAALQAHIGNGDVHITSAERQKLAGIAAGAQVNVIEKIKLNGTEVTVNDKTVDLGSIATSTALEGKVDKVTGKSLVSDTEITKLAGVSTGANKVEKSDTNGNIKIDGTEVKVYTPDANTVIDGSYKHITVTETSVSDGTTTFTKYDDAALAQRVTNIEAKEAGWDGKQNALDTNQLAAVNSGITAEKVADYDETKQTVDNFFASDAAVNDVIDTLKEITDYIANDKEGAADITASVGALETGKVDKVTGVVGNIVEFGANGAIADSGKKVEDFSEVGHKHVAADITDFASSVKAVKVDNAANAESADVADKVANKLTFGSKTFDGSAAQTITAADLGALTAHQDISGKADTATMTAELAKKVDKVEGKSLISDTEIARLAGITNYNDAEVRGLISDNADAIAAINNGDTGILKQAKDYADGLAGNYDAGGSAATAEANAKSYTDTKVADVQGQIGTKADGKTINGRLNAIEALHTGDGSITTNGEEPLVLNKLNVTNGHVVSGEFVSLASLLSDLTFTIDAGEVE